MKTPSQMARFGCLRAEADEARKTPVSSRDSNRDRLALARTSAYSPLRQPLRHAPCCLTFCLTPFSKGETVRQARQSGDAVTRLLSNDATAMRALLLFPLAKKRLRREFESSLIRHNTKRINALHVSSIYTHASTHVLSQFQALNRALPTT